MRGIDCTKLRCPEFTVPALRLIREHGEVGKDIVIKTLEKKAPKRIQHLCLTYGWAMLAIAQKNDVIFIKIKC